MEPAFLRRVVRYLIREAGIKQIIDVGAGLPTVGNTHEVALEACPQARVVYVDHDPIVLAHARSMLHGVPGTAVIGGTSSSRAWPGRRNGGRIPATRYPATPPSRTTAWSSPAPTMGPNGPGISGP